MYDVLNIECKDVYCVGDIHGEFDSMLFCLKQYDIKDSLIIFCGDIGLGFYKSDYYKHIFNTLKRYCKKQNIKCLFLRGNHDDPAYFNGDIFKKGEAITLRDYTLIKVNVEGTEKNILCVGGGISIDRNGRMKQMEKKAQDYMQYHPFTTYEKAMEEILPSYWHDEYPIYRENILADIVSKGINIDYICTHSCPSFVKPLTKDNIQAWLEYDTKLEYDIDEERRVMDNIYNFLKEHNNKLYAWYYGHYHAHNFETFENTNFYMLDMLRNNNLDITKIYF